MTASYFRDPSLSAEAVRSPYGLKLAFFGLGLLVASLIYGPRELAHAITVAMAPSTSAADCARFANTGTAVRLQLSTPSGTLHASNGDTLSFERLTAVHYERRGKSSVEVEDWHQSFPHQLVLTDDHKSKFFTAYSNDLFTDRLDSETTLYRYNGSNKELYGAPHLVPGAFDASRSAATDKLKLSFLHPNQPLWVIAKISTKNNTTYLEPADDRGILLSPSSFDNINENNKWLWANVVAFIVGLGFLQHGLKQLRKPNGN